MTCWCILMEALTTGKVLGDWADKQEVGFTPSPRLKSLSCATILDSGCTDDGPLPPLDASALGNTLKSGGKGKWHKGGAVVPSCYGGHLKADSPDTKNVYVLARAESKGSSAPAPLISKGKLLGNVRCRRYPPVC